MENNFLKNQLFIDNYLYYLQFGKYKKKWNDKWSPKIYSGPFLFFEFRWKVCAQEIYKKKNL